MAEGLILNFGAQRNEDYFRYWRFKGRDDDSNVDVTDWTFSFRLNASAGLSGDPLLSIGQSLTANGSLIRIEDAAEGTISVLIKKEDIAALPGRTADVIAFPYNVIVTDSAGVRRADVRGLFTVEPGV